MITALGDPVKILVLFLSMTVLSIFLDETGFFKYLADTVLRHIHGGQIKLFTAFYALTTFVTIFTSNDIIILTFTPFICYFTKNAGINPVPYLVSGFVAANTCSMLLIIGNPTNIYLGTAAGIGFLEYLRIMIIPTVFAVVTAYVVMLLLFRKMLLVPIKATGDNAPSPTENVITSRTLLVGSFTILITCTIILAISTYIGLEMWYVALTAACVLILFAGVFYWCVKKRPTEILHTAKRTPWVLVPFLLTMFIIVWAFEKWGVTGWLWSLFGTRAPIATYGILSTLVANIMNNIPMSVLFASIQSGGAPHSAVYASIIGSNIGAFLTPFGALAGLMWLSILKRNGIKFGFARFLYYGVIIAVPVLAMSLVGLKLYYLI